MQVTDAESNCTIVFCGNLPKTEVNATMGQVLDGFSEHMRTDEEKNTFVLNVKILKRYKQ